MQVRRHTGIRTMTIPGKCRLVSSSLPFVTLYCIYYTGQTQNDVGDSFRWQFVPYKGWLHTPPVIAPEFFPAFSLCCLVDKPFLNYTR